MCSDCLSTIIVNGEAHIATLVAISRLIAREDERGEFSSPTINFIKTRTLMIDGDGKTRNDSSTYSVLCHPSVNFFLARSLSRLINSPRYDPFRIKGESNLTSDDACCARKTRPTYLKMLFFLMNATSSGDVVRKSVRSLVCRVIAMEREINEAIE